MLTDLVLFRHAKAVRHHEAPRDIDRALTGRGRKDAARAAGTLAAAGFAPDLVLLSPSARTRETWQEAEPSFPGARALQLDQLYLAEPRVIQLAAEEAGPARILVIGHNPGLHDLACLLAERGDPGALARLMERMPTSAIAWLQRPEGEARFALRAYFSRPDADD
jgi:phosphohistidine phosphatase